MNCISNYDLIYIRYYYIYSIVLKQMHLFQKAEWFSSLHEVEPTAIKVNEKFAINFGNKQVKVKRVCKSF